MAKRGNDLTVDRRPGLLLGLSAYLLATGRWGSYLHFGPIFVTDAVVLTCLLMTVTQPTASNRRDRTISVTKVSALSLITVASVRMLAGANFNLTAARDFAPYAYAVIACMHFRRKALGPWADRLWTSSFLFHHLWLSGTLLIPTLPFFGDPFFGASVPVFSIRTDFDALVSAVAAAWFARRAAMHGRATDWLWAGWSLVLTLTLGSRVGVLGLAVAAIAVLRFRDGSVQRSPRTAYLLMAALVMSPIGAAYAIHSKPVQRLVGTFAADNDNVTQAGAAGTTQARVLAWQRVLTYIDEQPGVRYRGVGFGPDFLRDSGAASRLEGTAFTQVRSPHNYALGTYARLGVLGLVASLATMSAGIGLALRRRTLQEPNGTYLLSMVIAVTVPIGALTGVILESPFGAVPYFFALANLISAIRNGEFVDR